MSDACLLGREEGCLIVKLVKGPGQDRTKMWGSIWGKEDKGARYQTDMSIHIETHLKTVSTNLVEMNWQVTRR